MPFARVSTQTEPLLVDVNLSPPFSVEDPDTIRDQRASLYWVSTQVCHDYLSRVSHTIHQGKEPSLC